MTNEERDFQRDVRACGCIVCWVDMRIFSEGDIHHILNGDRKAGEMKVLCLCPSHHRAGLKGPTIVSRHPYRARFVEKYGSEEELYQIQMHRVAILRSRRV